MLNYIWAGMIIISYGFAAAGGRLEAVTQAGLDAAGAAVSMLIGLLGIMCFWSGIMEIAKRSGLTEKIAAAIQPVSRLLFPQLDSRSPALSAIVMNMMANFLGLSNAATPLGLKAMKELDRENGGDDTASDSMCMFVVINTAALDIIPTTVIALRSAAGSSDPFGIIVPAWISSCAAIFAGVIAARLFERKSGGIRAVAAERRRVCG